jgi:hypothetical protein
MSMAQHSFHSHYETLGVDRHASADSIRSAYRKLAQEYHPDRYQGAGDAAALMAEINAAYGVLSDFSTRVRYDSVIAVHERQLNPHRAGPARARVLPLEVLGSKPFMLVAGTAIVAVTVSGFVALNMLAPKRNTLQLMGGAPPALQMMMEPMPLVASYSIQPWTPPAKASRPVHDATEPVLRLVSEGTMKNPPSRRHEQASAQ